MQLGVKDREKIYRLIISQLFYDGYQEVAVHLSNLVNAQPACPPSDRLQHVIKLGLEAEEDEQDRKRKKPETAIVERGIDLEFETDVETISPEASQYETCYVTAHKGACRAGAYHPNGSVIATGSEDASIKILDVDRMLAKSATPSEILAQETPQQQMENHPVIRTLYDHTKEITWLAFHPEEQILASGSKDFTVKLFDFSKPSVKKATTNINEAYEVRCLSFHPSGNYLLVGTAHPTIRLYDVNTSQCFVTSNPQDQHESSISMLDYSPYGNQFVSGSHDGCIKLWDGVSNKCTATFSNAHDGEEVCSVKFSRNGKYVLSSGKDSMVKLWELSTSRCLIAYTGAGATGKQQHRTVAVFNHTEDYVFFPDEKTTSMCCWDSRNADRQRLLSLGHNNTVQHVVHSSKTPAFLTCSDDFRARFWCRRAETDSY